MFSDVAHFESIRLVRREPGETATVAFVSDQADQTFLAERREAQKLLGFTTATSEVFFARRALLVEGRGDALAARLAVDKLELGDVDAEDFSIIECGGKGDISFLARLCGALAIPIVVLHDEDIRDLPEDDPEAAARRESDNQREADNNRRISDAIKGAPLFIACPSLEEELGIGRNADDKPARVAAAISELEPGELPACLRGAVRALFDEAELGEEAAPRCGPASPSRGDGIGRGSSLAARWTRATSSPSTPPSWRPAARFSPAIRGGEAHGRWWNSEKRISRLRRAARSRVPASLSIARPTRSS